MADQYIPEIVKEVSEHTNLRQDIVAEVLAGFVDVATEKIINEKSFNILGLITIQSKQWKSVKIGDFHKEPHERLTVKISWRIRELKKLAQKDGNKINRLNWQDWHRKIIDKKTKGVHTESNNNAPKVEKVSVGFSIFDDE